MTPATKTKPSSVLAELETLEAAWDKAAEEASAIGREHGEKQRRAQELVDTRRRLVHREPGLIDHRDKPLEDDNQAALIDKEIEALGDLGDLLAKRDHARRLAESAKLDAHNFIATHFAEVVEEFRPTAEAAADAVTEKAEELLVVIERYMNAAQRSAGLTAPVQGIDGRHVPGIDQAANLQRALTDVRLPVPVPQERRLA